MPAPLGQFLIIAGLAAAVVLALRSLWKDHKNGKSCSCGGDCSHCKGCH